MKQTVQRGLFWAIAVGMVFSAISVQAGVSVKRDGKYLVYNFSVDNFKFSTTTIKGQKFQKLKLEGVNDYDGIKYRVGEPELPVIRLLLKGTPTITVGEENILLQSKTGPRLAPVQPPQIKRPHAIASFAMNNAAYKSSTPKPEKRYTLEPAGSVRGQKQFLLTLYPVSYAPAKNQYGFVKNFSVRVLDAEENPTTRPEVFAFIVANEFENSAAISKYKNFKESLGFVVKTILVEPSQTPEEIRSLIKELYTTTNLRYGLIFGDIEQVSSKESDIIAGVTDHYYRAIDTDDYKSDINGPDIGLGRISVKTEEDLSAVVEKYIKYELGAFDEENWLNGAAFLATNDRYEVAEGTHEYAINTYTIAQGYKGEFPNADEPGGDKLYAITHQASDEKVNEILGKGHLIIDYSGHGGEEYWDSPHVTKDNVRALSHKDATAFVISNACITGQFTVDESFAEAWQKHPAGAVMFWGSMDSTFWDEDDILERHMFDGIYREGKSTFADITTYALTEMWKHYGGAENSAYYWETYVTFGDPSQLLRTGKTVLPVLEGESLLPFGTTTTRYVILDANGQPLSSTKVSLREKDGPLVLSAVASELGEAILDFSQVGNPTIFDVTISGKNLRALQTELEISPIDAPLP